jgi:hypothetical protein
MRHLWLGVAADITMDITPPTRWRTGGLRQSVDRPRPGHTLARHRDQAASRECGALRGALLMSMYSREENGILHHTT